MKRANFVLLLTVISCYCHAQDTVRLHQYLLKHRYTVNLDSPNTFGMLNDMMGGMELFVLGEGGSHDLKLYERLKPALLNQLANLNLKYFFNESGRASAYIKNMYLHNNFTERPRDFEVLFSMLDKEKAVLNKHPGFAVKGIDFERGVTLQLAVKHLFEGVNPEQMPHTQMLLKQIADSQVAGLSFKKFEHFYRNIQRRFFKDSSLIKNETQNNFKEFSYLLSNPNINNPGSNRNKAMADNLLTEISENDTNSVYFLSIGTAHSIPAHKGSTVHFLENSDKLQSRILVMNLFCENCMVGDKVLDSHRLGFMQDDILACFSHAANSELVVFDLDKLPSEYDFIKEYGGLLLFARNQN